jgi:hypothetical protein
MKFKYLKSLIVTLVLCAGLQAQENIGYTWSRVLNNETPKGGAVLASGSKTDAAGNTYIIGYFSSSADFDPGAAKATLSSAGSFDMFFAKYDASGNYVYAKRVGGLSQDYAIDLAVDGSGNIYITGTFEGTVDFDHGNGLANLTSAGGSDIFFAKYDASGNYIYAKKIGGTGTDNGSGITVDGSGNVYLTGGFQFVIDFDPGAGTVNLTSAGTDLFIAKYNATGEYVYAKNVGGTGSNVSNRIALDATGNVYITGYFSSSVDFDPGAATATLTSAGSNDIFLAKYDASGNYVFANKLGGTGSDMGMRLTLDGSNNIYLTGMFSSTVDFDPGAGTASLVSAGSIDVFFAKYDAAGNYLFAKKIGGTSGELVHGIALDASGNIFITGDYSGTADFDPGAAAVNLTTTGSNEIYIAKYDAAGNYVFAKSIGGTQSDRGTGIAIDAAGNIYATGYFRNTADFNPGAGTANLVAPSGLENTYLLSLDNSGNYRSAGALGVYGFDSYYEYARSVTTDAAGNVYVAGAFGGTVDFDPGAGTANLTSLSGNDLYFAKYDASGNYVFAKRFGGTSFDELYDVTVDASGNIYLAGYFEGTVDFDPGAGTANLVSAGAADAFIAKYNASGEYVYAKRIGGTGSDACYSLKTDNSGSIYIAGIFAATVDFDPGAGTANLTSGGSNDIFFAKYDASGNYVYAKNPSGLGSESAMSIAVDPAGNVYLTGSFGTTVDFDPGAGTASLTSAGSNDIFIAKYDASGNYIYAKNVAGANDDYGYSLQVDASGNAFVTGYFTGTADFDPGAGTANLTSVGDSDIFLAKYDASGNYVFAKSIGSTGYDIAYDIALDASGNAYITGYFAGTADFDPAAGTANLVSAGSRDLFFAKYDASGNYVYAKQVGGLEEDIAYSIALDASGNVHLAGYITGSIDADPSATVITNSANNSIDTYIAKFSVCAAPQLSTLATNASPATVSAATSFTDGACRLLAALEPNGASPVSGTVNAQLWIESTVPTHGGQPFVARHYEITPATNTATATGRVTLYFTQQEFDDFNNHPGSALNLPTGAADAAGIANLLVAKYSGTSANGTGLPGSYSGDGTLINPADAAIVWNAAESRWEVSFDVAGFSGFIVQTNATTLPVSLAAFTVKKNGNQSLLIWTTASEQDNKGFAVERSANGNSFSTIGFVQAGANGSSTTNQNYSFTDASPLPGRNYYRLRQQDINGNISYSPIRLLNFSKPLAVLVYPNPAVNVLFVDLQNTQPSSLRVQLTDLQGRQLRNWSFKNAAGLLQLNVNGLAPGYYQLELVNDKGEKETHRIIKQ